MRVLAFKPVQDVLKNGLGFEERVTCAETQYVKTLFLQHLRPSLVGCEARRLEMLAAVYLHDQTAFDASEVGEERADGMLAAELEATDLAVAQTPPELLLGVGGARSQGPRPHPNPLPQAGEGVNLRPLSRLQERVGVRVIARTH